MEDAKTHNQGLFKTKLNVVYRQKMTFNKREIIIFLMPKTAHLVPTAQEPEKIPRGRKIVSLLYKKKLKQMIFLFRK